MHIIQTFSKNSFRRKHENMFDNTDIRYVKMIDAGRNVHGELRNRRTKVENRRDLQTAFDDNNAIRNPSDFKSQLPVSWQMKIYMPDESLKPRKSSSACALKEKQMSPNVGCKSTADPPPFSSRLQGMLEIIANHMDLKKHAGNDNDSVTLTEDRDPFMDDDVSCITDPISNLSKMKEIHLDGVDRPEVKIYRFPKQHIPAHLRPSSRPRLRQTQSAPTGGYVEARKTRNEYSHRIPTTKPELHLAVCDTDKFFLKPSERDSSSGVRVNPRASLEFPSSQIRRSEEVKRLSTIPELVFTPLLQETPNLIEQVLSSPSLISQDASLCSKSANEKHRLRLKPVLRRTGNIASF